MKLSKCVKLTVSLTISGDVEEVDGTEKSTLKIFKNITLVHESSMVMLEVSRKCPFKDLLVPCPLLTFFCLSMHSAAVDCQPSERHVR